ncbi:MAG: AI-2E family transporter [Lachnospiraceae bacterium]|nr:AI-2E family transporter [Lachnospiraceae bacterium]
MDHKQINHDNSRSSDIKFLKYTAIVLAALLIYRYFSEILGGISFLFQVAGPLLLGCILAYILNLIMVQLERGYAWLIHRFCKTEKLLILSRPLGIAGSFLLIVLFLIFLVCMVVPRISEVVFSTVQALQLLFQNLQSFAAENDDVFPQISAYIMNLNIDWQNLFKRVVEFASSGISSAFGNTFSVISAVTGKLSNLLFAAIFAIYVLAGKEKLARQINRLLSPFLKKQWKDRIYEVLDVFNQSFSSFITGQCIEAVILGSLCALGMAVLRLPYASVIGTLVGATALIPVLGAYIGGVIGFILIFTVAPIKAVYFVIFLCILQQLEGNLIYPRVVGASIGLPGIWVFAAVTVGGGVAGIPGMLIGVPLTAGIYQLLRKYIPQ